MMAGTPGPALKGHYLRPADQSSMSVRPDTLLNSLQVTYLQGNRAAAHSRTSMIALAILTSLYRRSLQIPDFANSAFLKLLGQTGMHLPYAKDSSAAAYKRL